MTGREFQKAFEIMALKYINIEDKPLSKEIEFWLNLGISKFVKTRYSGVNTKGEGFEQSQKRTDDLRSLVRSIKYEKLYKETDSLYTVELPYDYMFLVGESISIIPSESAINNGYTKCFKKDSDDRWIPVLSEIITATLDDIDFRLLNSLSEHLLRRCTAKPIKLADMSNIRFHTDGNYEPCNYHIVYIKQPPKLDIHSNPNEEYDALPVHTHEEILKLAVNMWLENQASPRYQTNTYEVATME